MRMRGRMANAAALLRMAQAVEKVSRDAILKMTPTHFHFIVAPDMTAEWETWAQIAVRLFASDYRIESAAGNTIHVRVNGSDLVRGLRSCHHARNTVFRLMKDDQHLPVLQFQITESGGASGRLVLVTHDVPIAVLRPAETAHLAEPAIPPASLYVLLPPLDVLKPIVDKLRLLSPVVTLTGNARGQLLLHARADAVQVQTHFTGLINPNLVAAGPAPEHADDDTLSAAAAGPQQLALDAPPPTASTASPAAAASPGAAAVAAQGRVGGARGATAIAVRTKALAKFAQAAMVHPSHVVCSFVPGRGVVLYVYVGHGGSDASRGDPALGGGAGSDTDPAGFIRYFLPMVDPS